MIGAVILAAGLSGATWWYQARLVQSAIESTPTSDSEAELESAGSHGSPPAALSEAQLAALLGKDPNSARSPFLTQAELAALLRPQAPERPTLPRLSGTMIGRARRVAWIDGRPYGEGDRFGAYEIERIGTGSARLRAGDESIELSVSVSAGTTYEEGTP